MNRLHEQRNRHMILTHDLLVLFSWKSVSMRNGWNGWETVVSIPILLISFWKFIDRWPTWSNILFYPLFVNSIAHRLVVYSPCGIFFLIRYLSLPELFHYQTCPVNSFSWSSRDERSMWLETDDCPSRNNEAWGLLAKRLLTQSYWLKAIIFLCSLGNLVSKYLDRRLLHQNPTRLWEGVAWIGRWTYYQTVKTGRSASKQTEWSHCKTNGNALNNSFDCYHYVHTSWNHANLDHGYTKYVKLSGQKQRASEWLKVSKHVTHSNLELLCY